MNAEARAREQQRQAAIMSLRSELQDHPDDAGRWARLGKAYAYADAASAIDAFDHATRLAPNVAEYWKQLGETQFFNAATDPSAGESSKAALQNCLQRNPQSGDCHCWLGRVQHSQGTHAAALQSFTRAAENGADCEYQMASELLELGEFEQSNVVVQTQLSRLHTRPGNFDQLYLLQELDLRIAVQSENPAQAHAARQRLAEYALGLSPEVAFNLGSTYAVARPQQATEAKQLLGRFVQSSCNDRQAANDCDQCVVARDLLDHLAAESP
jgi:predicted Zn-dependent protease